MSGAFAYLVFLSTRNKLVSQIKRLRSPRYAIALLLGLGYFWLVFFSGSRNPNQPNVFASRTIESLLPLGVLLYVAYTWIFGADRAALAFTQAEVSMLFTAPVSRRGLIIYKLARAQAAILMTCLVWLMLFRHEGPALARVASSWVFLSLFSLHRLGVALVRASHGQHGVHALRRHWMATTLFVVVAVVVVNELLSLRTLLVAAGSRATFAATVQTSFASAPLSWVLYPFRVAIAPMFAPAGTAWVAAMLPALALLALHLWWVLSSDAAFEEAAAAASAEQAKRIEAFRMRGVTGVSVAKPTGRRTLPLSPTGPPFVAIVWKNYLWLVRTGQLRVLVGLPVVALICTVAFAGRSELAEGIVVAMCGAVGVMMFVFGPMSLRNDLRGELRRLPALKTIPLTGRQIVLAEVLSSASPMAALQFLLAAVAMLALSTLPKDVLPAGVHVGTMLGSPLLLLGLNVANFTIHNGLAVLFPGWVKLGESGVAGLEAIGQTMLTLLITMFVLLVLLIAPTIAGSLVFVAFRGVLWLAVAGTGAVAGVIIGLESYVLMALLGQSLDRLEPMQVG